MRKKKLLTYGGLVVVLGIVAILVMWHKQLTTTIRLAESGGQCTVQGNVDKIKAKHGDPVTWNIQNDCGAKYFVEVRNFREILGNGEYGPVNNNVVNGRRDGSSDGHARGSINAKADTQGKKRTTYKYDIFIGTSPGALSKAVDPEYDIWP